MCTHARNAVPVLVVCAGGGGARERVAAATTTRVQLLQDLCRVCRGPLPGSRLITRNKCHPKPKGSLFVYFSSFSYCESVLQQMHTNTVLTTGFTSPPSSAASPCEPKFGNKKQRSVTHSAQRVSQTLGQARAPPLQTLQLLHPSSSFQHLMCFQETGP